MAQARIHIDDRNLRVSGGHPWVYRTQVLREEGQYEPGDIVKVLDGRGRPIGQGYINPASMIRVRLLSWSDAPLDEGYITGLVRTAVERRKRLGYTASCRLVFSEADGLPGLIVDRFVDEQEGLRVLVCQILSLGMERWRDALFHTLQELEQPAGIVLRNDVPVREREGLPLERGFFGEACPTELVIAERDPCLMPPGNAAVRMYADLMQGQKTGHFLDQVGNHLAMARVSAGRTVLDCFTHTGGFALHAARYGASEVLGLDISGEAVAMASRNAGLNAMGNVRFQEANVFDFLGEASRTGQRWDTIVLDPPAFAKNKGALENARRGYKEINLRAMRCLPPGGFLVTCSCSQAMTAERFREMVAEAARDAGRRVREVAQGAQPPDHPVHWSIPESHYLKCLVLEVL